MDASHIPIANSGRRPGKLKCIRFARTSGYALGDSGKHQAIRIQPPQHVAMIDKAALVGPLRKKWSISGKAR